MTCRKCVQILEHLGRDQAEYEWRERKNADRKMITHAVRWSGRSVCGFVTTW